MKERPILFGDPMMQAIRDGRKSNDRGFNVDSKYLVWRESLGALILDVRAIIAALKSRAEEKEDGE